MAFRNLFVLLLATTLLVRAQAPLNPPVPLAPPPAAISPGAVAESLSSARLAQEMGLHPMAISLYRPLLEAPGVDHAGVALALATVLLDDGKASEAEEVLQGYPGPHGAAWHLRAALAAAQRAQQKQVAPTRSEFDAIKPEELSKEDIPWFFFLQGMLTNLTDATPAGLGKANIFYQQALDKAPSEIARMRFQLAVDVTRLRLGSPSEADVEKTRLEMEKNRGRASGYYESVQHYAVALDLIGRKTRAVELLQDQLRRMPPNETAWADELRLYLGLIGGAADGAGRNALIQLLEKGVDAGKQRIALQLLARASQTGPARAQFLVELDRLIMETPPLKILEEAYLFRAAMALAAKNYAQAEDDARKLLQKFPGSPLLAHAYGVLTGSAWEQLRFHLAADFAAKTRDALKPGPARAEMGVIVAEAWFRAGQAGRAGGASGEGDFQLAAEAYAEALRDPPPGMPATDLMYQRVLAKIEAGALDDAERLLDEMARDLPNPINRWQAEWNLSRALQIDGKSTEALARVSALLAVKGPDTLAVPMEVRVRLAWLQAQLSFDVEPSEQTLKLIDDVARAVENAEPAIKVEIASTSALLKAQTLFALKRDAEGLETLDQLRKDFPKSRAEILSYMAEADYLARHEKAGKAQQKLTDLAHNFPESDLAPWALYKAALQAERREQKEGYEDAVRRVEELISLVEKYPLKNPANDLVFRARLLQGDLLRRLGDFPAAQQVYENLSNNSARHQDAIIAQFALAACYNAQSGSDPSNAEKARVILGHLAVALDVPVDARVEAGCSLGELLVARGDRAKALEVWWRDVVHAFLDDPVVASGLGENGRWWMGRTLVKMGDVLEGDQKLDEAKKVWELIVQTRLPGESVARANLARYNVAVEGRL